MVCIMSYKLFILWFRDRKEKFTISDVRRGTTLAPQTITKILDKLINSKNGYIESEGEKTHKKWIKLKDIDLEFFVE